mmetsp:Transcript_56523/g.109084  ORF Transcript_56523/g.109084 Transcript_56523/m.109084 type:complete len:315 (-) Transcript_56523:1080-2024(-)
MRNRAMSKTASRKTKIDSPASCAGSKPTNAINASTSAPAPRRLARIFGLSARMRRNFCSCGLSMTFLTKRSSMDTASRAAGRPGGAPNSALSLLSNRCSQRTAPSRPCSSRSDIAIGICKCVSSDAAAAASAAAAGSAWGATDGAAVAAVSTTGPAGSEHNCTPFDAPSVGNGGLPSSETTVSGDTSAVSTGGAKGAVAAAVATAASAADCLSSTSFSPAAAPAASAAPISHISSLLWVCPHGQTKDHVPSPARKFGSPSAEAVAPDGSKAATTDFCRACAAAAARVRGLPGGPLEFSLVPNMWPKPPPVLPDA